MAMTKQEVAEMEELQQIAEAKSLRWLGIPAPERVPCPRNEGRYNGWDFNTYDTGRVEKAWSENITHGSGHLPPGKRTQTGSKNGRALFATRLDALIGLRLAKELEYAKILARIDKDIDDERKQATQEGSE